MTVLTFRFVKGKSYRLPLDKLAFIGLSLRQAEKKAKCHGQTVRVLNGYTFTSDCEYLTSRINVVISNGKIVETVIG